MANRLVNHFSGIVIALCVVKITNKLFICYHNLVIIYLLCKIVLEVQHKEIKKNIDL